MKPLFCLLIVCAVFTTNTAFSQHKLTKLWETDSVLKVPESVLFDKQSSVLYVSNIDGQPWAKDGKGSIGKIGLDGKVIAVDWITGLNAPKGMALYKGKLYVADLSHIVVIDKNKGIIENKIPVDDSAGLNDLTVDDKGVLWASDSKQKKIYRVENGKPTLYLDNLKGPNGVLARGKDFFILDAGGAYKVEPDKKLSLIADGMEGGTDGIENVTGNDFLVSCWQGVIWYVNAKGEKQLLLDTKKDQKNTADIGFDPITKTVFVPTFWKNSIVAYKVE